jgi:hypothetical protein
LVTVNLCSPLAIALIGGVTPEPSVPPPVPFTAGECSSSVELQQVLSAWESEWPGLGPGSFEPAGTGGFGGALFDYDDHLTWMGIGWSELPDLCSIAPDSSLAFNLFPAGRVDDDRLVVMRDADSEVLLIDLRTRIASRVMMCGTTCEFSWGTWLSPAIFLVGGTEEADDADTRHLTLWRIDAKGLRVAKYGGPEFERSRWSEVAEPFRRWRATRFPNLSGD